MYCVECGTKLTMKWLEDEGDVPYCEKCGEFRFPMYNVAVSMIVVNRKNGKILLIKQYGKDRNVLVAGYVNRRERAEDAVVREMSEETGMRVSDMTFNRTEFFEPTNTLMCNFTVYVENEYDFCPNKELDSWEWYSPEDAKKAIAKNSLAEKFLKAFLKERL